MSPSFCSSFLDELQENDDENKPDNNQHAHVETFSYISVFCKSDQLPLREARTTIEGFVEVVSTLQQTLVTKKT